MNLIDILLQIWSLISNGFKTNNKKQYGMGWIPPDPPNDPFVDDNSGSNKVTPDWPKIDPAPKTQIISSSLPEVNIKEFEQYDKELDTYMKWRVQITNPLTNIPHSAPKSIITPVLLSQYLENIKLYESGLGAEYWEELITTQQTWIHIDEENKIITNLQNK